MKISSSSFGISAILLQHNFIQMNIKVIKRAIAAINRKTTLLKSWSIIQPLKYPYPIVKTPPMKDLRANILPAP